MSKANPRNVDNMVWIDLEMSGLDPEKDKILEIATIITDGELNILAEGPNLVVHQPTRILKSMDEWNHKEHRRSGLYEKVEQSKITLEAAEATTLEFLKEYCYPKKAPLCGNSVHHDRRFLLEYMPKITDFLHYRIIDVSTISGVITRWYPSSKTKKIPKKQKLHMALADVRESIDELRYLRNHFFR